MSEEEGLVLTLGPVLHGIGQHLHGHVVPTQVVAHKHHSLYSLQQEEEEKEENVRCNSPYHTLYHLTEYIETRTTEGGHVVQFFSSHTLMWCLLFIIHTHRDGGTHASDGSNVVGDGDKGSLSEVLWVSIFTPLHVSHVSKTAETQQDIIITQNTTQHYLHGSRSHARENQ